MTMSIGLPSRSCWRVGVIRGVLRGQIDTSPITWRRIATATVCASLSCPADSLGVRVAETLLPPKVFAPSCVQLLHSSQRLTDFGVRRVVAAESLFSGPRNWQAGTRTPDGRATFEVTGRITGRLFPQVYLCKR